MGRIVRYANFGRVGGWLFLPPITSLFTPLVILSISYIPNFHNRGSLQVLNAHGFSLYSHSLICSAVLEIDRLIDGNIEITTLRVFADMSF